MGRLGGETEEPLGVTRTHRSSTSSEQSSGQEPRTGRREGQVGHGIKKHQGPDQLGPCQPEIKHQEHSPCAAGKPPQCHVGGVAS